MRVANLEDIDFIKSVLPACIVATTLRSIAECDAMNDHSQLRQTTIAKKSFGLADELLEVWNKDMKQERGF